MPLAPGRAAGWRPRRTPGLAEPGPGSRVWEEGAGPRGCGCGVGRPTLQGPHRLGPLPARARPLRRRGASRRWRLPGAQARRRGARVLDLPGTAGQPGSCDHKRRGCMRFVRARAKGEGATLRRAPHAHPAALPAWHGAREPRWRTSPLQVCGAAPRRRRRRRAGGRALVPGRPRRESHCARAARPRHADSTTHTG